MLDGVARSRTPGTPAWARDWNRALAKLQSADLLDPSTDWSMARANYLMRRDRRRALAIAKSVVRRHPNNVGGWMVILRATAGNDPVQAARARREVVHLNPVPGTRR